MQPSGGIGTLLSRDPFGKEAKSNDHWVTESAADCTFSVTIISTPLSRDSLENDA